MLIHKRRTGTRHVTRLEKSGHDASVKLAIPYTRVRESILDHGCRSEESDKDDFSTWTMQSRDDTFNGSGTKCYLFAGLKI